MTPFLVKLHGHNESVNKHFVKGWKNGKVNQFGRVTKINEELIVEVTGMSMRGLNFTEIERYMMLL